MQGNSALFYMETQAFIRVVEILAAVVQSGLHAMEKALIKLNLFSVLLWKLKLIILSNENESNKYFFKKVLQFL